MIVALVVSNLLYPVVAVGVAAVACILIWLRHRRPKSVEANMRQFNKGLRALAPEARSRAGSRGGTRTTPVSTRLRPPAPTGLPAVPERPAHIPPPSRPMPTRPMANRAAANRATANRAMATTSPPSPATTAVSGPTGPSEGAEAEAG